MADPTTAEKLATARAKRAAIADRRAAAEAASADERALEAELLALRNDEAVDAAVAEHGPVGSRIRVIQSERGCIIVKRPHPALYKRYTDKASSKFEDVEKLTRPSVVYPSKEAFDAIIEEWPALMMACANEVCVLAGVRTEEVSGK